MKLYFSNGSCSLASHIVLEESGAKYETQRLNLREGEQRKPEYLALNFKGKVPTLQLDDGQILTENPAIMTYIADTHPQAKLLPAVGTMERARALEWLAWCASTVHAQFGPIFGQARIVDGEAAQANVKHKAIETSQANFDAFDRLLGGKRYVLGETFSAADAYTLVFFAWGTAFGLKIGEHFRHSAHALLERPAVKRVVEVHGLTKLAPAT
jgi:glutathione S-transferase